MIVYLTFFFISKLIGFSTGYALDDYAIVRQADDVNLLQFFVSQGRYGTAMVEALLQACGLTMSNFSTLGLAATGVFSGLFYRDALKFPDRSRAMPAVGLAALLGAHSYYTEYVSFRQAAFPMSLVFLGMWLALRLYSKALDSGSQRLAALLGSILLATFVMGINQLAVSFVAIAVLCVHARRIQADETPAGQSRTRPWLLPPLHAALAGATLIVCNLVVAKLTLTVFGVTENQRAALVPMDLWLQRAHELATLLPTLWLRSETVASWPAKALAVAALAVLLMGSLRKSGGNPWLALFTFIAATAAALIPTTASAAWWPVPRTLIAVPFALAAAVVVLSASRGWSQTLAGVMLIASGCIFAAHSQSILFNQQRLNRWDQMQARDISQLAVEKFPSSASKLAIVGASWSHDIARGITQGDLNVSALSVGWAVDPLFDEATGRDQAVRIAPELQDVCASSPKFPDPASMHEREGEVVVCMH